jgi:hypothetical protein
MWQGTGRREAAAAAGQHALFGREACKSSGAYAIVVQYLGVGVSLRLFQLSWKKQAKPTAPGAYPTVRPGIFREHSSNDSRAAVAVTRGWSNGGKWSTVAGGSLAGSNPNNPTPICWTKHCFFRRGGWRSRKLRVADFRVGNPSLRIRQRPCRGTHGG